MTKTITQNKVYLMDCLEGMRNTPDKWYDLAVVDPPYGININHSMGRRKGDKPSNYKKADWDNEPAGIDYLIELKRISKHQIIWGINYMDFHLKGGRLIWNKLVPDGVSFSDCEIAYCSMFERVENVYFKWAGMMQGVYCGKNIEKATIQQGNKQLNEERIHPTQKPVALYDWIFSKYATKGMKILDTHAGSMSSVISALKNDMQITAYEIDSDYFNAGKQRIEAYLQQGNMFQQPTIEFINH